MRDSTIIYRSFYEAIKELPKENQAEVWGAVFEYSLNFEEPVLTGLSKTIFTLIKPQLDANIKRYKNGCEAKNKQNGRKTEAKRKQNKSESEANENVNENVNEKENEKDINFSFDSFWDLYDKKVGDKKALQKKWGKLNEEQRNSAMEYIPRYIQSQPDKKYRLNPETFINQKRWNDELPASPHAEPRKLTYSERNGLNSW